MLEIIVKHTDDVKDYSWTWSMMLEIIVKHTDDVRDDSKTYWWCQRL
jgi:hypothetical protein